MNPRTLATAVALAATLILTACGTPASGIVTELDHDDIDRTWSTCHKPGPPKVVERIKYVDGKRKPYKTTERTQVSYRCRVTDPEHYNLHLDNDGRTTWHEVPAHVWHDCEVGDYYNGKEGTCDDR